MIVKFNKNEMKTLKTVDPKQRGGRDWIDARAVAAKFFGKSDSKIGQSQIRTVRNAFRKLVREGLIEMSATTRGNYRISEKGRKFLKSGDAELKGVFERGSVTEAAKAQSKARSGARPAKGKKAATKRKAAEKSKKAPKKAAKKSKPKTKKKDKIEVVDKTKKKAKGNGVKAKANNKGNPKPAPKRKVPSFKRRDPGRYHQLKG